MKKAIQFLLLFFIIANCYICKAQKHNAIDSLKRILKVTIIDTAKVNLYNKLAERFRESNPDSVAFYIKKSTALAQKSGYGLGLANTYIIEGNYNIILGNYPAALVNFKKSESGFQSLLLENPDDNRYKNGLARSYASQGVVYSEESNHFMALENYHKALKLYKKTGEKTSISKLLNNIGVIYKSQQNYTKALTYFRDAFKLQQEVGEQAAAVTLTNIGIIYFELKNDEKAWSYFQQANQLFSQTNNFRGLALLKNAFGDFFKRQNNFDEALSHYQQSLDLYEELQNKFGASLALYNIGQLHTDQKKYIQAMPFALKSLEYAKAIGVLDQTYHSEKLVSELYGFQNNPEQALLHYKNYVIARDSIFNQKITRKLAVSEMNAEYDKREALLIEKNKRQTQLIIFILIGILLIVVLVLVVYNRRQVKRRLTLQKEVAEYEQKALHLQMNPHFVFNCLSSISSFIVQNGTDSALKYLSKFSKLMRLTLEYSKGSLIPIDKEIESLQNYLELEQLRFHNVFEFVIHSSDRVEFNMGLPPLLIQPFVENAILHGIVPKKSSGKIEITFDVENNQLVCIITDNGIGISHSKHLKEYSVTAHKSMALEITKKRLEIMESTTSKPAQIEITDLESSSQTGTKVTLRLPIQYIQ